MLQIRSLNCKHLSNYIPSPYENLDPSILEDIVKKHKIEACKLCGPKISFIKFKSRVNNARIEAEKLMCSKFCKDFALPNRIISRAEIFHEKSSHIFGPVENIFWSSASSALDKMFVYNPLPKIEFIRFFYLNPDDSEIAYFSTKNRKIISKLKHIPSNLDIKNFLTELQYKTGLQYFPFAEFDYDIDGEITSSKLYNVKFI